MFYMHLLRCERGLRTDMGIVRWYQKNEQRYFVIREGNPQKTNESLEFVTCSRPGLDPEGREIATQRVEAQKIFPYIG